MASTFTLSGLVQDSDNRPLSGAMVSILGAEHEITTGGDGRYRIGNLAGSVTVVVAKAEYVEVRQTVQMDRDRTLDFTLRKIVPSNTWRGLTVAAEDRCSPYDSGNYSYPQSVEDDIIRGLGGIFSPYTCEAFDSKLETDVEHIVARSEAHDSGLCSADAATRRRFSRDLLNLTLASPALNRGQKGAKDAAEWQPDSNRCWFAQTVVDVRRAYGLTIDRREADALDRMLAGCSSTRIRCDLPNSIWRYPVP